MLRRLLAYALFGGFIGSVVVLPASLDRPAESGEIMVGAGDIAGCNLRSDALTADLLDDVGGTVFTLGDNAYPIGSEEQFAECYDPTWGRHKDRTRPVPGNHDYGTPQAAGYFDYFGAAAGDPTDGYYTYDLGEWQVYALNSNCNKVGGCEPGSRQYEWLADELAESPECTIVYWHHPVFTAAPDGEPQPVLALFQLLYDSGVDVLMTASSHSYERFAPLEPDGNIDETFGVRVFVVGTGGNGLRPLQELLSGTEASNDTVHGVLKLVLLSGEYEWEFLPADGNFQDSGRGECHGTHSAG